MDLYSRILLFCLMIVKSYSLYESFIKTANQQTGFKCELFTDIITNDTRSQNCNGGQGCSIHPSSEIAHYVCLKQKFEKSNCSKTKHKKMVNRTGCYVNEGSQLSKPKFLNIPSHYLHFLVLEKSIWYGESQRSNKTDHCSAFCYYKCDGECDIYLDKGTWLLLKISNNSFEDFGEFLSHPTTTSVSTTTTTTTTTAPATTDKMVIIAAVLIPVLSISVLMTFILYRKKYKNAKMTSNIEPNKVVNEIPSNNNTTDQGCNGNTTNHPNDDLYETIQPDVESDQNAQNQPRNPKSAHHELTYAELDLNTYPSPGGPSHSEVNGDFYANVNKKGEQNKVPEVVYAEVYTPRDTQNDSTPEGPSHVEVNGDLYATVNKEEDLHREDSYRREDLAREEVNGEIYTLIKK